MASSLALKRLVSLNILPSSLRVLRPIVTAPSASRVSNTNAAHEDEFDPLSPTRSPNQAVNIRDQFMKSQFLSASRGMATLAKGEGETSESKNILRPLSPHLPVYKPQLNATLSITNRISGAFLTTVLLFSYLLSLKMGSVCLTYSSFYQFFFYSAKLFLVSTSVSALALSYHTYYGIRHLLMDLLKVGVPKVK
ncbi:succinate dehydrogenase subunit 4 [Hibiscus syriacus]|uniref:Succinate dehydrogenase subunit 4 n=1 Tax=Hibiscus syriacus TaxID=106335 RepID=A0A6A3B467_HIBSY|nr:succinate dehydrogenase subunit 3-1, mitochondrial-like [Hibiscus syriacus]KAE8711043.1 succinate dehydrogenase subunit 4 [Hibiscus syriacus]